ncbi:unnamed protein product [Symbiodinium natans]|uniref:Uncharacterized protein n=1 Tax=Symbiodinium natans TaxID=878477 RepID=A0A812UVD7_9DINO|nr:unnamed protein product [Symbiodinium natans]
MEHDSAVVLVEIAWAITGVQVCSLEVGQKTAVEEFQKAMEDASAPAPVLQFVIEGSGTDPCSPSNPEAGHGDAKRKLLNLIDWLALEEHRLDRLLDLLKLLQGSMRSEGGASFCRLLAYRPVVTLPSILEFLGWLRLVGQTERETFQAPIARLARCILAVDREGHGVNQLYNGRTERTELHSTLHSTLHTAAILGEVGICKAILDHPKFSRADDVEHSPLPDPHYTRMLDIWQSKYHRSQKYWQEAYIHGQACGCTALHAAVLEGKFDVCSLLLQSPRFAAVAQPNANGQTALHMALNFPGPKYRNLVYELLQDGRSDVNARASDGWSIVHLAADHCCESDGCDCDWCRKDLFKELLRDARVDVNAVTKDGSTALHLAADSSNPVAIEKLLGAVRLNDPVDVNARDSGGRTALYRAVASSNMTVVDQLLDDTRVDVNVVDQRGWTALHAAVKSGSPEAITKLLDAVRDVNARIPHVGTALHIAVIHRSFDAIAQLLAHERVDANARGRDGFTALQLAVDYRREEAIDKFLGAVRLHDPLDVNATDPDGHTALHLAVQRCCFVEKLLDDERVDVNARTADGQTALDLALSFCPSECSVRVVEALVADGRIGLCAQGGQTSLHRAVGALSTKAIEKCLSDKQLDVNARTEDGETALDLALRFRPDYRRRVGVVWQFDQIIMALAERTCGVVLDRGQIPALSGARRRMYREEEEGEGPEPVNFKEVRKASFQPRSFRKEPHVGGTRRVPWTSRRRPRMGIAMSKLLQTQLCEEGLSQDGQLL